MLSRKRSRLYKKQADILLEGCFAFRQLEPLYQANCTDASVITAKYGKGSGFHTVTYKVLHVYYTGQTVETKWSVVA